MKKKNENEWIPIWIFAAWFLAFILFCMEMMSIVRLGLGYGPAFKVALGYTVPTAFIAALASFLVNKFKFKTISFHKFWFWILVVAFIANLAAKLGQTLS